MGDTPPLERDPGAKEDEKGCQGRRRSPRLSKLSIKGSLTPLWARMGAKVLSPPQREERAPAKAPSPAATEQVIAQPKEECEIKEEIKEEVKIEDEVDVKEEELQEPPSEEPMWYIHSVVGNAHEIFHGGKVRKGTPPLPLNCVLSGSFFGICDHVW